MTLTASLSLLPGHPTERFETLANQLNAQTTQTMAVGMKNVYLILYVTKVKIIRTKTGKQMAFLDGNDQVGETSITVFPNLFSKTQSWLHKDMVVLVKGNVEKTNDIQMVANDLQPAANALQSLKRQKPSSKWYLRIDAQQDKNVIFHNLNQLSRQYHGNVPVIVFETETKKTWALAEQFWLTDSPKLKEQLITIFGNNNVVYK